MAGFGAMNFLNPMQGLLGLAGGGGGSSQGLSNFMGGAAPNIASFYNTGSQKLSAPALSTLLGSMYQPQQGTPYAPGPEYYDKLLEIMREQATAGAGAGGMESLISALMAPQATPAQAPATPAPMDFGIPAVNKFMYGNLPSMQQQVGYVPNPGGNPFAFI